MVKADISQKKLIRERYYAEQAGMSVEWWRKLDRKKRKALKNEIDARDKAARAAKREANRIERLRIAEIAKREREALRRKELENAAIARLKKEGHRIPHAKQRGRALVDHAADPELQTEVSFGKALQSVAECMSAYAVKLDATKNCISPFDRLSTSLDYSEEARNLFDRFDKRYRGHVYRQLLKSTKKGGRYGFVKVDLMGEAVPMQGNLSGSDVFTAVWAKLFGVRYDAPKCGKTKKVALKSYFLDFDFSRERVGQGAFRAYLDEITYAVYRDMLARDTVPLKDIHGHVMHDKNGKVVYVSRAILDPPQGETKEKSVDDYACERVVEVNVEKNSKKRARLLLELSYLAYYRLCADVKVCPKWFKPYAKELFEQGRDDKEVRARARTDDSVPSAGAFDKELSCLRKKIRKLRDEMFRRMHSFATIETENGRAVHVLDPNEVLEQEWEDLALWVGDRRMHDIRYNVVRAIMG